MISNITDSKLAIRAPPASDVTVAMVVGVIEPLLKVDIPQVIAAAMSSRSTTKLDARTVEPNCVRSPNFITVQIKLTTNAANNS